MSAQRERFERQAKEIKCLVCSTPRVVFGLGAQETGECPRCRYRGWDYADELDGFTNRMIKDGAYSGTVVERRKDPRRRPQTR